MKKVLFFTVCCVVVFCIYLYFSRSRVVEPVIVQNVDKNIQDLSPKEAQDILMKGAQDPDIVLIDVRTPQEFAQERLINAININSADPELNAKISILDKERVYIVYCKSGVRSKDFREKMVLTGHFKTYSIKGGIEGWKKEKLPLADLSLN